MIDSSTQGEISSGIATGCGTIVQDPAGNEGGSLRRLERQIPTIPRAPQNGKSKDVLAFSRSDYHAVHTRAAKIRLHTAAECRAAITGNELVWQSLVEAQKLKKVQMPRQNEMHTCR